MDMWGPLQRAWVCAGYGWFADRAIKVRELDTGGPRPVLCLPADYCDDPERLEEAFGWAIATLYYYEHGWIELVRGCRGLPTMPVIEFGAAD